MKWFAKLFGDRTARKPAPGPPFSTTPPDQNPAREGQSQKTAPPKKSQRRAAAPRQPRARPCDVNRNLTRFRFLSSTTREAFLEALKSLGRKHAVIECIGDDAVLTLGLNSGCYRFQLWQREPFGIQWSLPVSNLNRIFDLFDNFSDGLDISNAIRWLDDDPKYGFALSGRPRRRQASAPASHRPQTKAAAPAPHQVYAQLIDLERQKAEERLAQERVRWEKQLRDERVRWETRLREADARKAADTKPPVKDAAYYAGILGVALRSDAVSIKAAYRIKVKEYHPDLVATLGTRLRKLAEDETKLINEAYRYLLDHA